MKVRTRTASVNSAPGLRLSLIGFRKRKAPVASFLIEKVSSEVRDLDVVHVELDRFPETARQRQRAARYARRRLLNQLERAA